MPRPREEWEDWVEFDEIPVDSVVGWFYARKLASEEQQRAYQELRASIETEGVKTPIKVLELPAERGRRRFKGICGFHRWLAAKEAGYGTIPAIIYPPETPEHTIWLMIGLDEVRIPFSPADWAYIIHRLKQAGMTQKQIAEAFGRSEAWVSQHLKLMEEPELAEAVKSGRLSFTAAREIRRLPQTERKTLIKAAEKGTPTREIAELVRKRLEERKIRDEAKELERKLREVCETLAKMPSLEELEKEKMALDKEITQLENKLKEQRNKLSEMARNAGRKRKELEEALKTLRDRKTTLNRLQDELEGYMRERDKLKEFLSSYTREKRREMERELRSLKAEYVKLAERRAKLLEELRRVEERMATLETDVKRLEEELKKVAEARSRLGFVEQQIEDTRKKIERVKREIKMAQETVERLQAEGVEEIRGLNGVVEKLEAELRSKKASRGNLVRKVEKVRVLMEEKARIEARLAELRERLAKLA